MKRRNDSDMKRSKERYMYKSRIKRKKKSEKKLSFIENGLKIIKPLRQRLPTLSYLQFNLLNKCNMLQFNIRYCQEAKDLILPSERVFTKANYVECDAQSVTITR